ncbi:MAG: winged helix-turn-helix transcriptional regulator [Gemmatimonadota bacterium]|nr:MAG: winged helix-turn-helix transcriptional regulator [Gemmatimonadota bacterium]
MVLAKTSRFGKKEIWMADLAKALSHPVRIKILQILSKKNTCICGELVELLPLAQSTVSQHLKELKRVGLIRGDIEGPRTCYCLDENVLEKARVAFTDLFSTICKC